MGTAPPSSLCAFGLVCALGLSGQAQSLPAAASPTRTAKLWSPRVRSGVRVADAGSLEPGPEGQLEPRRLKALGLRSGIRLRVEPSRWPTEPAAPVRPVRAAFRRALAQLCPHTLPLERVTTLADASLDGAEQFGVDPFTLAALVYQQSRCGAEPRDSWGVGPARINLGMHRNQLRDGHYRYRVPLADGQLRSARLRVDRYPATRDSLAEPSANLYFAAAFLHVFSEQCPHIDAPFHSAPHRHPVSHLVWGDHVRSGVAEDFILTARRRLIAYYGPRSEPLYARYRDLAFTSPLDGPPRVVIGLMGDPRGAGKRVHAGIDLVAALDEPVRAMASGRVSFAGVELRSNELRAMGPQRVMNVPSASMGPRGLFVRLDHGQGVHTLYVHLAQYLVTTGDHVQRGELLGYVGRTGMHTSDAHLHLGIFDRDNVVDPLPHLGPLVLTGDASSLLDPELSEQLAAEAAPRGRD